MKLHFFSVGIFAIFILFGRGQVKEDTLYLKVSNPESSCLHLTFLICRCRATLLLKRSTGDSPPELTSRSEVTAKTDKIFKCQIHTECLISKQIYSLLGSIAKRASFTLLRKPSCTKIDNFSVVVQPTPKQGNYREKNSF